MTKKMLIAVTMITLILSIILFQLQSQIGVYYWDVFIYLNNALVMAGFPLDSSMLYLPPVLPFITSIFFRLGFISQPTLFAISAAFYFFGVLGLYLLLRFKFNEWESLAGSLSFASFTIITAWAVTGTLDVPAIALSIWTIFFTIIGRRKDGRFYTIAFPLAVISFLTRYTSALIILPMLFIIFADEEKISKIKYMITGVLAGAIVYLPFLIFSYIQFKSLLPFKGVLTSSASGNIAESCPGYNPDPYYYIRNLLNYISAQPSKNYGLIINPSNSEPTIIAYIIIAITIIGVTLYVIKKFDIIKQIEKGKTIILIIIFIILISSCGRISYVISEIILFLWVLNLYWIFKESKDVDVDITFITWFFAFLLLHSFHEAKVDRYFITMTPPIAYAIALGINGISSTSRWRNKTSMILSVFVAGLMLLSAFSYVESAPKSIPLVEAEKDAAKWLISHEPTYKGKVIAAERGPAFQWYLKVNVSTVMKKNLKDFKKTFDRIKPDYYIYEHIYDQQSPQLEGYEIIYKNDKIIIFKKKISSIHYS
mgnify:CR=1 FL=1